jgi:outer membrane receptor protein involved in Fe transport
VRQQQFQNVGRVKNTGLEVEGGLALGRITLRGQYGYARARVEQLSPTYAGDLEVGDQARLRPKHTAGASVTATPLARTTISAGLAYVGSWTTTDFVALFGCFGGTEPCRPTGRDYVTTYPGLVKLNASLIQQFTPLLSAFVSVENLTNNEKHEISNLNPVTGRSSTFGLRLQY